MKQKLTILSSLTILSLLFASPVHAQTGDVTSIETFIKSIILILVKIAGLVSAGFFVWGGFNYITSSGNPEQLDRAKKTVLYSGFGLAIVLGAFMLTNIVSGLATGAFGSTP